MLLPVFFRSHCCWGLLTFNRVAMECHETLIRKPVQDFEQ